MRKRYILTLSTILALFSIFAVPVFASDATLFLSPITGTYITGDVFTISVNVDSGGAAVNAIEGKLEYDPKELTVIDIDTTSPIVTSWVQQPTFDNSSGVISFGGSLATSTVLSRQSVFKFRLRGERSGEFRVRFITGAAIHAADGTGGNIVSTLSNGIYAIVPSVSDPDVVVTVPTVESSSLGEVLGAATGTSVMSSTHPDQNTWYPLATSSLSWDLPLGLSAVRLSLDKKPNGQGVVEYAPTVHDKVINKIRDGVSYFHLTRIYQDEVPKRRTINLWSTRLLRRMSLREKYLVLTRPIRVFP